MPRLPQPGGDDNTWGDILNQFMLASHNADGSLRSEALDGAIADGSITNAKIANGAVDAAKLANNSVSQNKLYTTNSPLSGQVLTASGTDLEWQTSAVGVTDHALLSNVGTNTHVQIDTHIVNTANPHNVTKAQVGLANVDNTSDANKPVSTATQAALNAKADIVAPTFTGTLTTDTIKITGGAPGAGKVLTSDADGDASWVTPSAGVTDHGALSGLSDDDHAQYHTDARGDARYYTQSQINSALTGKAGAAHTHVKADITDFGTYANAAHTHTQADITNLPAIPDPSAQADGKVLLVSSGALAYGDASTGSYAFRGDWNVVTDYIQGEIVLHNGSSWGAIANPAIGDEPGVSANWDELEQIGSKVTVGPVAPSAPVYGDVWIELP
jgi:hypothetical protein